MRILFAASEMYGFAKSGGLGDVSYGLPKALNTSLEVDVILPLYSFIDENAHDIVLHSTLNIELNGVRYSVTLYTTIHEGMHVYFVNTPTLSTTRYMYNPPNESYDNNGLRFGLFCHAIVKHLKNESYDCVHLNDWQTGLVPLLIDQARLNIPTLFTIHNLAFQGNFDASLLQTLNISKHYFTLQGAEFYGKLSFMKAAIKYATMVNTVSASYAKEIQTREFGCGMHEFIKEHAHKLKSVINGIDTVQFDPKSSKYLAYNYSTLEGKKRNKEHFLLHTMHLDASYLKRPFFGFIGRMTWQKGLDALLEILPWLLEQECVVALSGAGESHYTQSVQAICSKYDNAFYIPGYDEKRSHQIYASSDFLLMPSVYEPCGLNQLIAMHFGALPIVHRTGGLRDTVLDCATFDVTSPQGFGIVMPQLSKIAFKKALTKAFAVYTQSHYKNVVTHNQKVDVSWNKSAKAYTKLYEELINANT